MKEIIIALLLVFSPAASEPPTETGPNFNEPSRQEVPEDIPRDRCIMAIYGAELQKERGMRIGGWRPPVSENTRAWLYMKRAEGKLTLRFCDDETA